MRTHGPWLTLLAPALLVACMQNPAVENRTENRPPTAVAWLDHADFDIPRDPACEAKRKKDKREEPCPIAEEFRRAGCSEIDDGGMACATYVEFDSAPVTVTLDASYSTDRDGEIAKYRWLSANFGPGCEGRDDNPDHDPADRAKPKVTLDEGFWEFSVWAIDDDGATSEPSVVSIRVGANAKDPCPNGPRGAAVDGDDAGATDPGVDDELVACVSDCAHMDCEPQAKACDANEACWPLVGCVASNCGNVSATDITAVAACAFAYCSAHIAGQAPAIAVAECALACRDNDCTM